MAPTREEVEDYCKFLAWLQTKLTNNKFCCEMWPDYNETLIAKKQKDQWGTDTAPDKQIPNARYNYFYNKYATMYGESGNMLYYVRQLSNLRGVLFRAMTEYTGKKPRRTDSCYEIMEKMFEIYDLWIIHPKFHQFFLDQTEEKREEMFNRAMQSVIENTSGSIYRLPIDWM